MKALYVLCAALAFSYPVSAANITAVQNGSWTSGSTWDLSRVPTNNDIVYVPVGIRVMLANAPYPKSNPAARPVLQINIYGILDFSDPGNDKLYLNIGSVIRIYAGGEILTTNNNPEIVAIYNGSFDNTVWSGDPNTVSGPATATATSDGFAGAALPLNRNGYWPGRLDFDGSFVSSLGRPLVHNNTSLLFYNPDYRCLHFTGLQLLTDQQLQFSVTNINGNKVLQGKLSKNDQVVPLRSVPANIYVVRVQGDQGFTFSKEIMVNR